MAKSRKYGKKKGNLSRTFKFFCWLAFIVLCVAVASGIYLRRERTVNAEDIRIYIPSHSSYDAVVDTLVRNGCFTSREAFDAMSQFRRYTEHVKSGSYIVESGMAYYDLVNKLRAGNQDPITVVIGRQRLLRTLCDNLGNRFEFSGNELYSMLCTESVCNSYGFTRANILALFVQNSYEFYWNISATDFLNRMHKEYERFWNSMRLSKCDALNLTPAEVTALAAIVDEETNNDKEKPLIASVYLNRVRKHMPLQADPTVRYAVGDFTIRRVLTKHTLVDSPYNTYQRIGIPPGPICIPSEVAIDAVLANKKTDYLYFCAKEDFSGSHNFASTLAEHQRNADKFHKALNARNIKK